MKNKNKDKSKSDNVFKLVPHEDNPDKLSSQQKRDELVDYLIELAALIDSGEVPADRAVLFFYKNDEDGSGFQFSPRTIGMSNTQAIFLCELGKNIFINEMLDHG